MVANLTPVREIRSPFVIEVEQQREVTRVVLFEIQIVRVWVTVILGEETTKCKLP